MQLIETKTLGTAAASIEFTLIPQTFTDLVLLMSVRSSRAFNGDGYLIRPNSTTLTRRYLYGDGASVVSGTTDFELIGTGENSTANTFANASAYFPNYASTTTHKSVSLDGVSEHNGTNAYQNIVAGLYASNTAITSIQIAPLTGPNFVAGSTISLYGILKGSDGIVTTS